MSRFGRTPDITDHHDVTDEDIRADLYGRDYHFWSDVDAMDHASRNRMRTPIQRLSESMTAEQRNDVVNGDLIITPEMLAPFQDNKS